MEEHLLYNQVIKNKLLLLNTLILLDGHFIHYFQREGSYRELV